MKKILFGIACMLLVMCVSFSSAFAAGVVTVISFAGDVDVRPKGATASVTCTPDMVIKEGTRIVTGDESYVEIAFNKLKNNIAKVEANSDVIIKLDGEDKIELLNGELVTVLKGLKKGETFRVRTPDAVCGARGTAWKIIASGDITVVAPFDSKVFIRGLNKDGSPKEKVFWVKEGFMRKIKRFQDPGGAFRMPKDELAALRKEFGMDKKGSGGAKKEKFMGMQENRKKFEERVESIQNKKDNKKLDEIREKKEKTCPNETRGTSIVSG